MLQSLSLSGVWYSLSAVSAALPGGGGISGTSSLSEMGLLPGARCVGGRAGVICCDDSYALNCVSYSSSVALFECSQALDVTPLAFCSSLHIGLFNSVEVLGAVRRRGTSLSSSLILPSFERRMESDFSFFFFFLGYPISL